MTRNDKALASLINAMEIFTELEQVDYLQDCISETLRHGNEETKLDKVHYLFNLQWEMTQKLMSNLNEALEETRSLLIKP